MSEKTPQGWTDTGRKDFGACVAELHDLQDRLFAAHHSEESGASVLLVLQAMDTAGKGGIVRHFLRRIRHRVPGPGMIGVFDRFHHEDVLSGKVRQLADDEEIEVERERVAES